MIDRQYSKYVLTCDCCGLETTFDTFQEAVDYKKASGWKAQKLGEDWIDYCTECWGNL